LWHLLFYKPFSIIIIISFFFALINFVVKWSWKDPLRTPHFFTHTLYKICIMLLVQLFCCVVFSHVIERWCNLLPHDNIVFPTDKTKDRVTRTQVFSELRCSGMVISSCATSGNCQPFRSTWVHPRFLVGFVLLDLLFCVCFVGRCLFFCTFFLAIVLSVLLRYDWPFGIFKLFLLDSNLLLIITS
jgi:hypothetical protein